MKKDAEVRKRIKKLMAALGVRNQVEFAKLLKSPGTTLSAWMTGDSLPSPDAYMRLGSRAVDPSDSLFFWEKGGLTPEAILSAANKLFAERIVQPGERDLVHIPMFEGDFKSGRKKSLVLPAKLLPNAASTCFLEIGEELAGFMLRVGDLLVLERNLGDLSKPGPFFGQTLLIEHLPVTKRSFDFNPTGLVVGWLNLQCVLDPRYIPQARTGFYGWGVAVYPLSTYVPYHFLIGGYPGVDDDVEEILARGTSDQARKKAANAIRLDERTHILGRIIAWFPSASKLLEEKKG